MGAKEPRTKLIQSIELAEPMPVSAGTTPGTSVTNPLDIVKDMPVSVEVRLGSAQLTVEKLLELKEGSVVVLDRSVDDPVDIFVNGKLVARGQLVASDNAFGVRITDVLA